MYIFVCIMITCKHITQNKPRLLVWADCDAGNGTHHHLVRNVVEWLFGICTSVHTQNSPLVSGVRLTGIIYEWVTILYSIQNSRVSRSLWVYSSLFCNSSACVCVVLRFTFIYVLRRTYTASDAYLLSYHFYLYNTLWTTGFFYSGIK